MKTITSWLPLLIATVAGLPLLSHGEEPKPTIAVHGQAQIALPADSLVITATLEGRALRAEKSFDIVTELTKDIIANLKLSDIPENAMRAQPILIAQTFQNIGKAQMSQSIGKVQASKSGAENIADVNPDGSSYIARRQFQITLTDIEKLNTVQLGMLQRGVGRMDRVEYKSSKSEQEYAKLRQAAVRDARTKATAMAGELGAELASIKSMVDQSGPSPSNVSSIVHSNENTPFGGGMGGSVTATVNASTIVTHVASVDIVFYLGKTELTKTELTKTELTK